jgi:mycothiol synthase
MPTEPPLPTGFTLRAAAPGDEPIVAALAIAQDLDDLGEADFSEDDVRAEWSAPGFDPGRDAWLVLAGDGTPAAFASVEGEAVRVFMDPRFKGQGIGAHLAARAEAHAREHGGTRVLQQAFGANDAARDLLAARGYESDQHFWRMRVELDGRPGPAQPEWPEGLTPRRYERERDEHDAHRLIQHAFEGSPGMVQQTLDEWRASWGRPGRIDPALTTVVADADGRLVGVATCAVHDDGRAYLSQLAVDQAVRGRGLGRALLVETFRLAAAARIPSVALDVNAANANATALYESAGMHAEWHTDRWTKPLG